MSLTQLQAYYQPWLKQRSLRKELLLFRKNFHKVLKATIRKTKSKVNHNVRSQYYLTTAFADARKAASNNEDIVITMTILAFVLSYSTAAISLDLILTAFSAVFALTEVTQLDSSIFIVLTCGSLAVIAGWLAALVMNMQSIALMEGANRKRLNTVRSTVRKSLKLASRVTYSWLLMGVLIAGIPMAGGLVAAMYLSLTTISMLEILGFVPYAITAGIAWVIIMLMEYSLLPHIMLFEPELSLRQTLRRSSELVKAKGRIFVLFANLFLWLSLVGAYGVAVQAEALLGVHRGLHFFGYALVILLLFNAVMTLFYRKRKRARK